MVLVNFRHITCTRAHVQIRNHGGIINGAAQGGEFENLTNSGGGDPLYTLHRAEGLYGSVRYRGYMRDSLLKGKSGRHQPHRRGCTAEGPSSIPTLCSQWFCIREREKDNRKR